MPNATLFIVAIFVVFGLLPVLFLLGMGRAFGAIAHAPGIWGRFGMSGLEDNPLLARLAMAALLLLPLSLVAPKLAFFIVGIAALLLPVLIAGWLLIAALCGLTAPDEGFSAVFRRIARPVPVLLLFFVLTAIPVGIGKMRAAEEVHRLQR